MLSQNSDFPQSNSQLNKVPKSKAQYSRNVKKLKLKLAAIYQQIQSVQKKIKMFESTSNDKMIALKISKFCKERRITPQMLFRCADRERTGNVGKTEFKDTLIALGIKLSQFQMQRLQYLLDEDISGFISWTEYNSFLSAFRIKGQFDSGDQFLKTLLEKIDLNQLSEDQKNKKHKQLLNYQQFLKFCHRYFKYLKDKQIAAIFNLLQKNNLIDIDQFIDYLKKRQQEKRKVEQKNKNKNKKDVVISKQDQSKTLKGLIKILLKTREKDSKTLFHSIQFIRLQKITSRTKQQLLQIFKQIDKQRRGSFGFNQIIQFYIQKQKNKDLLFAYQLMGRKMYIDKLIPQDVLYRYNGGPSFKRINLNDFKKFMQKQFAVNQVEAQLLFRALEKKQSTVPIRTIIDAMKLQQGQKRIIYIKPTDWKTSGKDYWKKNHMTILFNPFVALRFCIHIMQQLKKSDQTFWDDFQFGPIMEDPYGVDSIALESIVAEQVKWLTVQSLGMSQFYFQGSGLQYSTSIACPSDNFTKALCQINLLQPSFIWSKQKIDYNVRKVEQSHLKHIFQGIYPLAFHSFAAYGIYVFRYFVHQKWAYVIIDNKIPCNLEGQPLFSFEKEKKYSWISLIEKGYAKIKGNYSKTLQCSIQQYIYELNRKVAVSYQIKNLTTPQQRDKIWTKILKIYKQIKEQKLFSFVSDQSVHQLVQNKTETGFLRNFLYQIINLMEIKDEKTENYHKSHRLIVLKNNYDKLKNQQIWNPSWNSGQAQNKYDRYQSQIQNEIKTTGVDLAILKQSNTVILNYKLFRNIFDKILWIKNPSFDNMIILRKTVEFQEKFSCKYQINSKKTNKQQIRMLITLNRIRSPDQAQILITLSPQSNAATPTLSHQSSKRFISQQLQIPSQTQNLQLKINNWKQGQDYVYSLTFYILSPRFHLRELDRQILFRNVSPYQQMYYLQIDDADERERKYVYRNFFKAAERETGCCG